MKMSKLRMTAAAMAAMLLLGGCGDAPYELTDQEERIIVNYSAHILSKYNRYQREGLSFVSFEQTETEVPETPAPMPEETVQPEGDTSLPEGADPIEPEGAEDASGQQTATLQELFGTDSLSVSYVGARLADSYVQDEYYALNADAGKNYLIIGIDVTNAGEADAEFNQLALEPKFETVVNGDVTSSSELTFLLDDFSTYEGTVAAGATTETVLLFQVPDTVPEVASLQLNVAVGGNNYQIIL